LHVRADGIAEVSGDTVRLSVRQREMVQEGSGAEPRRAAAPIPAGIWWPLRRLHWAPRRFQRGRGGEP
jgi:hypothetical protein